MKKQDTYKVVGIVLLVLMFIALWAKQRYALEHNYLYFLVLAVGILLYTFEGLAKLFVKYWMKLGKLLGDINARIILSVLFLVVVIPVALLKKLSSGKATKRDSNWDTNNDEVMDFTKPW